MTETVDTLVVGGGQAGLAVSYHLAQQGRPHVVLEQAAQAGEAWRNYRWDSFTFVTPNWMIQLPGAAYAGPDPDGYLVRIDGGTPLAVGQNGSVAAPIADASGEVIAAVHVHGPSYRFPPEGQADAIGETVEAAASRIGARLRA